MLRLVPEEILSKLTNIPTILVGGTNGKGTTCALLEKSIRDAGYSTALYTSPHLVSPTERIRLDGHPISRSDFFETARKVFTDAQANLTDATFFELVTATALHMVANRNPDAFVCEVGLGGRFDSTNVLTPTVSILTSIGLDHTEWLGDTEEKIGFEKIFISRRNRKIFIGNVSVEARQGIERGLEITGGIPQFVTAPERADIPRDIPIQAFGICGEVLNHLGKMTRVHVLPDQLQKAALAMQWPGRLDLRAVNGTPILLDGAHNSHGLKFFLDESQARPKIKLLPKPWFVVFASLQDKDWKNCLQLLIPHAKNCVLTQTQSTRAVSVNELLKYTESIAASDRCLTIETSAEALDHALSLASKANGTLVVLGSLTLVGEALEHFDLPVFTEFESGVRCNSG
ncbi:MAG: bifunctional folylpolyglutamate synthase/dihydrofolate synthase [Silvanigrellaceae bacterium]